MTKIENGKIFSDGNQSFNVPNTEEGLTFIKALRKFSNPKKKNEFACRGRGSRIEYAKTHGRLNAQACVSKEFAEWFAVYMDSNVESRQTLVNSLYTRIHELEKAYKELNSVETLNKLHREIERLNGDFNQVIAEKSQVTKDNDQLNDELSQLNADNAKLKSEKAYLQTVLKQNIDEKKNAVVPAIPVSSITITIPVGTKINVVQS